MLAKNSLKSKLIAFFAVSILVCLYILYGVSEIKDMKFYESINVNERRIVGKISKIFRVLANPQCGRFPMLTDLNVSDINWQVTNTTTGTFYLFNAYFDDREALKNHSVVRILALINKIDVSLKAYCQFWFDGMNEPIPVQIQEYLEIWPKYWGENKRGAGPYLITCPNPLSNVSLVPQFVSFVEQECGHANNILEIRNKRPKNGHKDKFLVSVKALDFQNDISLHLIEYLEFLKILGANKVEIFVVNAHPNVIRVLKMYQADNFISIKFIKFPHEFPNHENENWHQFVQSELVAYHDSFYENLHLYEYMIPIDVDEFMVPLNTQDRTWTDLLTRTIEKSKVKNENFDAYSAMNMYFLLNSVHKNETIPGIPKNLRFLSNIYRAANCTPNGGQAKSFMRMDRVVLVHNHFPLKCFEYCKWFSIPTEDGHLAHYRTDCDHPECKLAKPNPIRDTTLWKYKDEILENVNATLARLKEFKSDFGGEVADLKLT